MTIRGFPGLNLLVILDLASQVADDVLGGFLNTLLHVATCNLTQHIVTLDVTAILDKQNRTGGNGNSLIFAGSRFDSQLEICLRNISVNAMGRAVGAYPGLTTKATKADGTGQGRAYSARFCRAHATGMEGTHGQLGTRLTNGLGSHNAHSFPQINQLVVGQSPAIAMAADGFWRLTGEGRADLHFFDLTFFKLLTDLQTNFCVARPQKFFFLFFNWISTDKSCHYAEYIIGKFSIALNPLIFLNKKSIRIDSVIALRGKFAKEQSVTLIRYSGSHICILIYC